MNTFEQLYEIAHDVEEACYTPMNDDGTRVCRNCGSNEFLLHRSGCEVEPIVEWCKLQFPDHG